MLRGAGGAGDDFTDDLVLRAIDDRIPTPGAAWWTCTSPVQLPLAERDNLALAGDLAHGAGRAATPRRLRAGT